MKDSMLSDYCKIIANKNNISVGEVRKTTKFKQ